MSEDQWFGCYLRVGNCPMCGAPIWANPTAGRQQLPEQYRTCAPKCEYAERSETTTASGTAAIAGTLP
jgi:hypothetical protein